MENQLKRVAASYDSGIDLGRRGIDPYQALPPHITQHPYYPLYQKSQEAETLSDSGRKEIAAYLAPREGMRFVDLGCCLNLMFRGYRDWPSLYYGVDISGKTIELLREFVEQNHIKIGDLFCGSMHATPYSADFFDIGACIGSLEYFEEDFVRAALAEAHRILKPQGRLVLDIPDAGSAEFHIAQLIEAHLGRADCFNLSVASFEAALEESFQIERREKVGPMIQYFLVCRK